MKATELIRISLSQLVCYLSFHHYKKKRILRKTIPLKEAHTV